MNDLKYHPIAEIFPLMEGNRFSELVEDVRENGLVLPITMYEGKILDGRNRYRACRAAEADPKFVEYEGSDPLAFVTSLNYHRRNLDASQRAMVTVKIAQLRHGVNKAEAPAGASEVTQREAAKMMNVSRRAAQRARVVSEKGTPELVAAVEAGEISVTKAEEIARLPQAKQNKKIEEVKEQKTTPKKTTPKKKTVKRHAHGAAPREGMQIARSAASKLNEIRDDDLERAKAYEYIKGWIEAHE